MAMVEPVGWLDDLIRTFTRERGRRADRRVPRPPLIRRLVLERLEERLAPATNITVIDAPAGEGNLDKFLSATSGTITTADDPGNPQATLSTGALQGVGPGVSISISADNAISFNKVGALKLQTASGSQAGFFAGAGGIQFTNPADSLTLAGGSLQFSAGALNLGSLFAPGADIVLQADSISFNGVVNAGTGAVQLSPFNSKLGVNLGGEGENQLNLADSDLNQITAGVLRIGSLANTGGIEIGGPITAASGWNTLSLVTAGAISEDSSAGGSLTVPNLALQAGAGVGDAANAVFVNASNVAFANMAGAVNIANSGSLIIASVDGLASSSNGGATTISTIGPVTLAVNVVSAGTLTIAGAETEGGAIPPAPPPDDDVTVLGGVTVESTSGDVVFQSGDSIVLQPGSLVKSDAGAVHLTAGVGDVDADGVLTLQGGVSAANGIFLNPTVSGFVVTVSPLPAEEGTPLNLTVAAVDALGRVATGYSGTVHFSSSLAQASLPAEYTFQPGDHGVHTFTGGATFPIPGTGSLTAVDVNDGRIAGAAPLTVANVAPTDIQLGLSEQGSSGALAVAFTGSFTDPGTLETHTVVIDWGDGSAATTLNLAAGTHAFTGAHVYSNKGNFTANVQITDSNGGTDAASISVVNAAPTDIQLGLSGQGSSGALAIALTGSFTDPRTLETHTVIINWGDGSPVTTLPLLAAGTLTFTSSHDYPTEGNFTATVLITDSNGGTGAASIVVPMLPATFGLIEIVTAQPGQTEKATGFDRDSGETVVVNLVRAQGPGSSGELVAAELLNTVLPPLPPGTVKVFTVDDIRQFNLSPGDQGVVTIIVPTLPPPGTILELLYVDPATGTLKLFIPSSAADLPTFSVGPNGTTIFIRFDQTSTPKLTDLSHTVFTVTAVVPTSTIAATISSAPVASASPSATAPIQTTSFQGTSLVTFTLAASQAGQASAGLLSLNSAANSGGSEVPTADAADAAWIQFVVDEFGDDPQAVWHYGGAAAVRLWLQKPQRPPSTTAPAPKAPPDAPMRDKTHPDESRRDLFEFLLHEPLSNLRWDRLVVWPTEPGQPPTPDGTEQVGRPRRMEGPAPAIGSAALAALGMHIGGRKTWRKRRAKKPGKR